MCDEENWDDEPTQVAVSCNKNDTKSKGNESNEWKQNNSESNGWGEDTSTRNNRNEADRTRFVRVNDDGDSGWKEKNNNQGWGKTDDTANGDRGWGKSDDGNRRSNRNDFESRSKGDDWTCGNCQASVFASRNACFRCNEPKPSGGDSWGKSTPNNNDQGWGKTDNALNDNKGWGKSDDGNRRFNRNDGESRSKGDDWTCGNCQASVFASRNACFRCKEPKPSGGDSWGKSDDGNRRSNRNDGESRSKGDDWTCGNCQASVFASRNACFRCKEPKPSGGDSWGKSDDGNRRSNRNDGESRSKGDDWTCGNCQASVFASRNACFRCKEPKPGGGDSWGKSASNNNDQGWGKNDSASNDDKGWGKSDDGNQRSNRNDDESRSKGDDWTCGNCQASVFASRNACFRCKEPKPGGGDEGNKNGQKRNDWECKCGHNNFASRDKCQKCFEEKPKSDNDEVKEIYCPTDVQENELFESGIAAGINFHKLDNIPVEVIDKARNDAHQPIKSFESAGLNELILENLNRSGYKNPLPIQKHSIPIIMHNRDLIACAQTGSGKTAAFLLPIIQALMADQAEMSIGQPHALIVSPVRELTIQIYNEARKFSSGSIVKCAKLYGGTSVRFQHEHINGQILVATPGRLLDFCEKNWVTFEKIRYLVLDEADRMLDMGFKDAIDNIVKHVSQSQTGQRQTLMFSATFPRDIQRLAESYMKESVHLKIGTIGGANTDVIQEIFEVDKMLSKKRNKLMEILNAEDPSGTIIFVEQRRIADNLAVFLSESDHSTTSIHGARKQSQREEALSDFRSGKMKILIATSLAARGLDIKNVRHVINFDMPKEADEYVHRIGRTGRVGNVGKATSFYCHEQDSHLVDNLKAILSNAGQKIPDFFESGGKGSSIGDGVFRTPKANTETAAEDEEEAGW